MGRRSSHSPQQLRAMILDAAYAIIESHGLMGLSAREIARRIEYSPGTIYNMFDNLDDVVLQVEATVLDALDLRLQTVLAEPIHGPELVRRLAEAYLVFSQERPKLWNLLFEHHLPPGTELPNWYREKLELVLSSIEQGMTPLIPTASDAARKRAARVLWAGVHGITGLSTADKLSIITPSAAGRLIDDLVATYLAGLEKMETAKGSATCPTQVSPASA